MSLEEPEYTILKQTAEYEIRKYGDRLAVEAFETGGENRAFSLLFSYISGANDTQRRLFEPVRLLRTQRLILQDL